MKKAIHIIFFIAIFWLGVLVFCSFYFSDKHWTNRLFQETAMKEIDASLIAGILIYYLVDYTKNKKKEDERKFNESREFQKKHRGLVYKVVREIYKKDDHHILSAEKYLLYKDEWMSTGEKLCPLEEIDNKKIFKNKSVANSIVLKNISDKKYSELIQKNDERIIMEDRFCYRLIKIEKPYNAPLILEFGGCTYLNYINTCEVLLHELCSSLSQKITIKTNLNNFFKETYLLDNSRRSDFYKEQKKANNIVDIKSKLKNRKRQYSLYEFEKRNAIVGINTLLYVKGGKNQKDKGIGDFLFLHRRDGPNIAEAIGTIHVVPAGTFQPDTWYEEDREESFSITRTILREFGEELLKIDKLQKFLEPGDNFYDWEEVKPWIKLYNEGSIKIYFLGIGLDPLTTKPEMLTCMLIDGNKLDFSGDIFSSNEEGKHFKVELTKNVDNDKRTIAQYRDREETLPACKEILSFVYKNYESTFANFNEFTPPKTAL